MGQKIFKKYRKEMRKEVRKNIGTGLTALGSLVRPRPKWIPKKIWILFFLPLFKKKHLSYILENMQ